MSRWQVDIPPRLYEENANLSPGGRRALHDLWQRLAEDPRPPESRPDPIPSVELRRILTEPAADTGDSISVLYRVHPPQGEDEPGRVEIIFILAGP